MKRWLRIAWAYVCINLFCFWKIITDLRSGWCINTIVDSQGKRWVGAVGNSPAKHKTFFMDEGFSAMVFFGRWSSK